MPRVGLERPKGCSTANTDPDGSYRRFDAIARFGRIGTGPVDGETSCEQPRRIKAERILVARPDGQHARSDVATSVDADATADDAATSTDATSAWDEPDVWPESWNATAKSRLPTWSSNAEAKQQQQQHQWPSSIHAAAARGPGRRCRTKRRATAQSGTNVTTDRIRTTTMGRQSRSAAVVSSQIGRNLYTNHNATITIILYHDRDGAGRRQGSSRASRRARSRMPGGRGRPLFENRFRCPSG